LEFVVLLRSGLFRTDVAEKVILFPCRLFCKQVPLRLALAVLCCILFG
jgi:hypothetical protein